MRYFLDTEFIEDGRTIEPVSIGVVCDDGREFYAEVSDVDLSRASDWVKENVLPHLWHRQTNKRGPNTWNRDGGFGGYMTRKEVALALRAFVAAGNGAPEFWAYYADYDWVLVCQLFGRMIDLPSGWPMLCMDIKQLAIDLGDPPLPEQIGVEHHALCDARGDFMKYAFLRRYAAAGR